MSTRTVLGGAVLLLALAGCGADDPAPAAAGPTAADLPMEALPSGGGEPTESAGDAGGTSPVDPCTLVTAADARTLLGIPVLAARPAAESCTYDTAPTGPTGQVMVAVGPGAKKTYDIDRELAHEFRPLPGVGDEAWAEESAVFVRKGALWVSVSMVKLNDPEENRAPLETVAKTVAGRL